jgi:hypothetical protein
LKASFQRSRGTDASIKDDSISVMPNGPSSYHDGGHDLLK